VALIWGFPTLWVLYATFAASGRTSGITLANLVAAWNAAPFGQYTVNTLVIVGGLLLSQGLVGMVVGFILARYEFPGKSLITAVFLMQIVVPVYAVLIQDYQIIQGLHLLNTRLGIMLPYAVSGIAVLAFRHAFRSVPRELEEAARMDGYDMLGVFRRVYLPRALPAAIAFAVISVTYHWTDFLWPLIVTNTSAARPVVVGLAMLAEASESGLQWNLLAAGTAIVIIPVLIVFVLGTRRILSAFSSTFDWW
jgi:sn-glycerol 3-phosphate transport system permease protein